MASMMSRRLSRCVFSRFHQRAPICSPVALFQRHPLTRLQRPQQDQDFERLRIRHYCQGHRFLSTNTNVADDTKWETCGDRLSVTIGEEVLTLPFLWLRDHCRCKQCYNHDTNQKNILIQNQDANIRPEYINVSGSELTLLWPDGHSTSYQLPWLKLNSFPGARSEKVPKVLWDKQVLPQCDLPRVQFDEFVSEEAGLRTLLRSLLQYGIGLVDGVPADLEGTRTVAERVCFVQTTLFGGMWSFSADAARGDTAYTSLPLGAHTDSTYLSIPTGLQVFHCVHHDGTGGETLLLDGFKLLMAEAKKRVWDSALVDTVMDTTFPDRRWEILQGQGIQEVIDAYPVLVNEQQVAEDVRHHHPDDFSTLCKYRIHHEYAEPQHHLRSLDPILKVHPLTLQLEYIRYNQYDRAPLSAVPTADIKKVYSAIGRLGRMLSLPENEFWLKLRPGTVLFVDNWRVLHGRAAFTGSRRMTGCYLPRDDWIGKARILDLVWR